LRCECASSPTGNGRSRKRCQLLQIVDIQVGVERHEVGEHYVGGRDEVRRVGHRTLEVLEIDGARHAQGHSQTRDGLLLLVLEGVLVEVAVQLDVEPACALVLLHRELVGHAEVEPCGQREQGRGCEVEGALKEVDIVVLQQECLGE